MAQSISSVLETLIRIKQIIESQIKEFIAVIATCKSTYIELFQTGGIQSTVEGADVVINFQSNVCGDILIFICPREEFANNDDIPDLIRNDTNLEQQKELALNILRQKQKGLIALPRLISFLINTLFISVSLVITSQDIWALFHENFELGTIKELWPWIFPLLTFFFRKSIGFKIISFLL